MQYYYYLLFWLSGFTGLIYESIWAQYLKLNLGHAAFAHVIVLSMMMGGMTVGAWLAAKYTHRIAHLLKAYAITELGIGFLAVAFHYIFLANQTLVQEFIAPSMGSYNYYIQWILSALIILPQTLMLGATFPFMSGGLLRQYPEKEGKTIALLYFFNSFGGAIGILFATFLLIPSLGLPGTMNTAGFLNIFLASMVWVTVRGKPSNQHHAQIVDKNQPSNFAYTLLSIALLTGLASFMYEIGWIRLISLILGSSTHAFELMISAFILGLALGSYFIRNIIHTLNQPLRFLGTIQIFMGLLAAFTVAAYANYFEIMSYIMRGLSRTDEAYTFYSLFSHILAFSIMIPATFFAGMTLPLITHILLKNRYGEKMIGQVYASNTIGAILGIVIAIHFVMPILGLKSVILIGGLMDILIGIGIYLYFSRPVSIPQKILCILSVVALAGLFTLVELNPLILSSSIFRTGKVNIENKESLFHEDGKTASVDVVKSPISITISTNGKTDASYGINKKVTGDESTQHFLGLLPMLFYPEAKEIAIIGMGSGSSSEMFLRNPNVSNVTTIEIEPAMVEGAKFFKEFNPKTFSDKRSNIVIHDAKTYFASSEQKYDIIMSEPSNPWVSGVASLFTKEFYQHINQSLQPNGVFLQWVDLYALSEELVSSILLAIEDSFQHYQIYNLDSGNLGILAYNHSLPTLKDTAIHFPEMKTVLSRIKLQSLDDVKKSYLGEKEDFAYLIRSYLIPANSDFFPVVDTRANKARFTRNRAHNLAKLSTNLFSYQFFRFNESMNYKAHINPRNNFKLSQNAAKAQFSFQRYLKNDPPFKTFACHKRSILDWERQFHTTMDNLLPSLTKSQATQLVEALTPSCDLPTYTQTWLAIYEAFAKEDYAALKVHTQSLLPKKGRVKNISQQRALKLFMISCLKLENYREGVRNYLQKFSGKLDTPARFLAAELNNRSFDE